MLKMTRKDSKLDEKEQAVSTKAGEWAQWQQIKTPSTIISRRSCHSSCIYEDKLYIYGGYDSNSPGIFKDLVYFSFEQGKWKEVVQKGDLPGPRHSHTLVLYSQKMYLFGGMYDFMSNTNKLHVFDFKTDAWAQVQTKNTPAPLDSHSSLLYKNKMITTLGYSDHEYNGSIYSLDLDTLKWAVLFDSKHSKMPHPEARSKGSCCLFGDEIVIFGGKDGYNIYADLWSFHLKHLTFTKIQLNLEIEGRFGHCGIIEDKTMFIFGGTRGVTHERNDLVAIDLQNKTAKVCWVDSQQERKRVKDDINYSIVKKSRRDSAKKGLNWMLGFDDKEEKKSGSPSPSKYRTQLKQVQYYNSLYDRQQKDCFGAKKTRKNPLLKEINQSQTSEKDQLSMTVTFEILTNSILLTQGKGPWKEDKSEINHEYWRKIPKARDNSSVNILRRGSTTEMIIFGGGMHKIQFNDILRINLKEVEKKYLQLEI